MPSTADLVAQTLARDAVAREGLRRGIVGVRALARWMIASQGWAASEDAVLSALRRSPAARAAPDPSLRAILQGSRIDTTSGVASVMLKGGLSSRRVADGLQRALRPGERFLRVVASGDDCRLVVHGDRLPHVLRSFDGLVDDVREHLTELSIRQTKASLDAPGVVAYIVGALSFAGINFVGIVRHRHALQLLVKDEDAPRALDALASVVGPRAMPEASDPGPGPRGRAAR